MDFLEYTARAIAYIQFVSKFLLLKVEITMRIPIAAFGPPKA